MRDLGIVVGGAIAVGDGRILAAGPSDAVRAALPAGTIPRIIDASGGVAMPGFVDPHTHLVFAGTREREYALRIEEASYEEILAAGGGIFQTTRLTRAASEEQLVETARRHLDTMLRYGTTTAEAKSGYGLDPESELKLLRVIRRLDAIHPIDLVPTFLGAHVVAAEYRDNPDAYVELIVNAMLPRVSAEQLAEYCDVWCDEGIFSVEQSRRILEAARQLGLRLRLHANQLSEIGGTRLAVEVGADSVDHLERLPEADIPLLAAHPIVATLVPGVAFSLNDRYPAARKLIDAGVAVALASDLNPGSCFTESIPMVIALACNALRMTPEEAITAATINAAWSINRADRIGSLEPGKQADIVLFDMPNYLHLPYHFGVNLVRTVIKAGKVVVEDGALIDRS